MTTNVLTEIPKVAYEEHPAYVGIDPGKPVKFTRTSSLLNDLVSERQKLCSSSEREKRERTSIFSIFSKPKRPFPEQIKDAHKQFIAHAHAQLNAVKREILTERTDWSATESQSIDRLIDRIRDEMYADISAHWWQTMPTDADCFDEKTKSLHENGYLTFQLESKLADDLRRMVETIEANIRELNTRDFCNWPGKEVERQKHPDFFSLLESALTEQNILKMAGTYLRRAVVIERATLMVYRPHDQWWRNRYSDIDFQHPETYGMHFDSGSGMMKVMLYLNDVSKENGAFCYLPRTKQAYVNSSWSDYFRILSAKALPYGGIHLESPETRRLMLRLPEELRQDAHYGNDLLAGTEVEKDYAKLDTWLEGEKGFGILFDNLGLHKGGMTTEGERVAVVLNMRPHDAYNTL